MLILVQCFERTKCLLLLHKFIKQISKVYNTQSRNVSSAVRLAVETGSLWRGGDANMSNKIANAHEIIIGSCAIRGDKFASEAQHWLPSRDEISVFIFVCIRRTVPSIIHDGYNVDRDVYHRDVYRVFFFFF